MLARFYRGEHPSCLERDRGIEPLTLVWKTKVIPFYESRMVRLGGVEPPCLAASDFKSDEYTSFSTIAYYYWCERRDSNSHALRRWNLNPVRLPIPPLSHYCLPLYQPTGIMASLFIFLLLVPSVIHIVPY